MMKKISALLVFFFIFTSWCYCYIDPGTGSYLVQIIIAVFVGASFAIRLFWKKIKAFFVKPTSNGKNNVDQ